MHHFGTFDDSALQRMHRVHDSQAIPAAMESLRAAGFEDVSLDLIFSLPESIDRDWRNDLERAIWFEPTHISLYGLTVESDAPLGKQVARGEVAEATSDFVIRAAGGRGIVQEVGSERWRRETGAIATGNEVRVNLVFLV